MSTRNKNESNRFLTAALSFTLEHCHENVPSEKRFILSCRKRILVLDGYQGNTVMNTDG